MKVFKVPKKDKSPSILRQEWLEKAGRALDKLFTAKGHTIPDEVRVSIGWPKGSHGGKKAIGQCWAREASSDAHAEIFISPELGHDGKPTIPGSIRIMGVLAHEYVHAVAGHDAGHRVLAEPKDPNAKGYADKLKKYRTSFPVIAASIGLQSPWKATTEGREFEAWAKTVVDSIGKYPGGSINQSLRKKAGTRLLKCECPSCGYIARVTRKWVEEAGAPVCPTLEEGEPVQMTCEDADGPESGEGDEE